MTALKITKKQRGAIAAGRSGTPQYNGHCACKLHCNFLGLEFWWLAGTNSICYQGAGGRHAISIAAAGSGAPDEGASDAVSLCAGGAP